MQQGSEKYADIFKAFRVRGFKACIIRPAKEVGRSGVEQEIKILRCLKGGPNILELENIIRDNQVTLDPPNRNSTIKQLESPGKVSADK